MQAKRTSVRDASNAVVALLAFALPGVSVHAQQAEQPAPAAESAVPATDTADLQAMRRSRDAQIAGHEYQAALKPALDLITAQQQSPHDVAYAGDVAALGRIYAELREIDKAESRYLEAIALIAKAEGEFTPTLIDVYRGLGRSYIRGGRYPEAITTLEAAQNISQRNLGLFNVEQSPLLDDITTAYLGLGDTVEAQRRQLDRLDNAVRRFGADDPRVIPFRYVLANYYERSRLPESASKQYEEVLKSQTTAHGDTDAALLGPLRQLVKIDLLITQVSKPERRDQLAMLLERLPDADPVERGLSLAVLGDWATVANDSAGVITVFLGDGAGSLSLLRTYNAGVQPRELVMVDLNGDGVRDMVVAGGRNSSFVDRFLGNNDGTFRGPVNYSSGPRPNSVDSADFDLDGKADVAVANWSLDNESQASLSILFGDGLGDFPRKVDLRPPTGIFRKITALAAGQLDQERFKRGDSNVDGSINITDPIVVLRHLFQSGEIPCEDAADFDDNGTLEITDVVGVLSWLFLRGEKPGAPHPAKGVDPTPDRLRCGS